MYSSTTLKGPSESGCWKQLDYSEQNADSLFRLMYKSDLGIAAHAVMQHCVERNTETEDQIRKTGEEVGNLLIREGRTFRGHHEPPLPADDVWAGVDVAVSYLLAKGLPIPKNYQIAEVEKDYQHPYLPYRALTDLRCVYVDGDDESSYLVDERTDYKSSWQDKENELDTLQRWGQLVIARYNNEDADVLRQRVINLRTWQDYTRDLWLDNEDDVAELEKWEKRIAELCETANSVKSPTLKGSVGQELMPGTRPSSPGVGCLSCQYRHICEESQTFLHLKTHAIDKTLATEYTKAIAYADLLKAFMLERAPEIPIKLDGGYVGYQQKARHVIRPGKENAILSDFMAMACVELPAELQPALYSLLSALDLKKSNLDAFAKALFPERKKGIGEIRDEYVASITDEVRYGQFGVWKD